MSRTESARFGSRRWVSPHAASSGTLPSARARGRTRAELSRPRHSRARDSGAKQAAARADAIGQVRPGRRPRNRHAALWRAPGSPLRWCAPSRARRSTTERWSSPPQIRGSSPVFRWALSTLSGTANDTGDRRCRCSNLADGFGGTARVRRDAGPGRPEPSGAAVGELGGLEPPRGVHSVRWAGLAMVHQAVVGASACR